MQHTFCCCKSRSVFLVCLLADDFRYSAHLLLFCISMLLKTLRCKSFLNWEYTCSCVNLCRISKFVSYNELCENVTSWLGEYCLIIFIYTICRQRELHVLLLTAFVKRLLWKFLVCEITVFAHMKRWKWRYQSLITS